MMTINKILDFIECLRKKIDCDEISFSSHHGDLRMRCYWEGFRMCFQRAFTRDQLELLHESVIESMANVLAEEARHFYDSARKTIETEGKNDA